MNDMILSFPQDLIVQQIVGQIPYGKKQQAISMYVSQGLKERKKYSEKMMENWEERLSGFLKLWGRKILQDTGKVTAELAKVHAEIEFENSVSPKTASSNLISIKCLSTAAPK